MSDVADEAALSGLVHDRPAARVTSRFEFWPGWVFHAPIFVQWILLGLRYGDLSLPTAANPHITTGGLCGESKAEILDQMSGAARALVARYVCFTASADQAASLAEAEGLRAAAEIDWPLVAKPDIGCNGTGVRLVQDIAGLAAYLADFPAGARVMLQKFIADEGEAGIFYIRHPDEACGRITSLTLKSSPVVVGDGRHTLRELILADPRAGQVPEVYFPRLAGRLDTVPLAGERVRLVFVGNHCKGALFRDGAAAITPALTAAVEQVARGLPDFHYGRLDVRFTSMADLRRGAGFRIIEVNGVGAEATHVWDPEFSLRAAWAVQFRHYRTAFEIARANRRRGFRSSGAAGLIRAWWRQHRLLGRYPLND
jgi:hypothetical protein